VPEIQRLSPLQDFLCPVAGLRRDTAIDRPRVILVDQRLQASQAVDGSLDLVLGYRPAELLRELRRGLPGRAKRLPRSDKYVVLQVALDLGLNLLANDPFLHLGVRGQQAPLLSDLVSLRDQRQNAAPSRTNCPSAMLAMRDSEIAAGTRPCQTR
jgi:hypothetical protein